MLLSKYYQFFQDVKSFLPDNQPFPAFHGERTPWKRRDINYAIEIIILSLSKGILNYCGHGRAVLPSLTFTPSFAN